MTKYGDDWHSKFIIILFLLFSHSVLGETLWVQKVKNVSIKQKSVIEIFWEGENEILLKNSKSLQKLRNKAFIVLHVVRKKIETFFPLFFCGSSK